MNQRISVGRIVHFVIGSFVGADGSPEPVTRPAVVVRDNGGSVNLSVFTDGSNDDPYLQADECSSILLGRPAARVVWRTSITEDPAGKRVGAWTWPPYVPPAVRHEPAVGLGGDP